MKFNKARNMPQSAWGVDSSLIVITLPQSWSIIFGTKRMVFKQMSAIDAERHERIALQVGGLAIRFGR